MTKGGMSACVPCVIARATRGDEGGGGVAREETGKGVARDVCSDGRFGRDIATPLPTMGVSLKPPSLGTVPSRRAGPVDVKRHSHKSSRHKNKIESDVIKRMPSDLTELSQTELFRVLGLPTHLLRIRSLQTDTHTARSCDDSRFTSSDMGFVRKHYVPHDRIPLVPDDEQVVLGFKEYFYRYALHPRFKVLNATSYTVRHRNATSYMLRRLKSSRTPSSPKRLAHERLFEDV